MELTIKIIKRPLPKSNPELEREKCHQREYLDLTLRKTKRMSYKELLVVCMKECGREIFDLKDLSIGELERVRERLERL